eukprot:gene3083-biopygen7389
MGLGARKQRRMLSLAENREDCAEGAADRLAELRVADDAAAEQQEGRVALLRAVDGLIDDAQVAGRDLLCAGCRTRRRGRCTYRTPSSFSAHMFAFCTAPRSASAGAPRQPLPPVIADASRDSDRAVVQEAVSDRDAELPRRAALSATHACHPCLPQMQVLMVI